MDVPMTHPVSQPKRADLVWLSNTVGRAGRRVGRPGPLWLGGLAYSFLSFGWTFGLVLAVPFVSRLNPRQDWLVWMQGKAGGLLGLVTDSNTAGILITLPLVLAFARLASGLTRVAPAPIWDRIASARGRARPVLRDIWRRGRGVSVSTGLLWLQVLLMMALLAATLILPAWAVLRLLGFEGWSTLTAVLSGAAAAMTLVYGFLLGILFQLALHSLMHNRRGIGSALLHAWRLARNDPGATIRATAMDAGVQLVATIGKWLSLALAGLGEGLLPLVIVLYLLIASGFGCIRCLYWADIYEEFGGQSTAPIA